MGQLIDVVEKPSTDPGVIRFELNRSLSGQGHMRFTSAPSASETRPAALVARLLFETGQVTTVHVYANQVTVGLAPGRGGSGLGDVISEMYQYWKPGVEPPTLEELTGESDAAAPAAAAGGDQPELSEAAKKIPAHLLARSQAAKAKAKAKG